MVRVRVRVTWIGLGLVPHRRPYATLGSNPRRAGRLPGRPATHCYSHGGASPWTGLACYQLSLLALAADDLCILSPLPPTLAAAPHVAQLRLRRTLPTLTQTPTQAPTQTPTRTPNPTPNSTPTPTPAAPQLQPQPRPQPRPRPRPGCAVRSRPSVLRHSR